MHRKRCTFGPLAVPADHEVDRRHCCKHSLGQQKPIGGEKECVFQLFGFARIESDGTNQQACR